jgi:hypothetical protein
MIVKPSEFESPPPGDGLRTSTGTFSLKTLDRLILPEVRDEIPAISSGSTWQVSSVELTKVVAFSVSLKTMAEPETKLVPVAVRVKEGMWETFDVGEIESNIGVGFSSPLGHWHINNGKTTNNEILMVNNFFILF